MAEPVSSIITIATVSLAIIKETVKYVEEVRLVDRLVARLLTELKDLHELIKVVDSTYKRASPKERSKPSSFVRKYLTKCKDRLKQVKALVVELASQETSTIFQKFVLKRQSDAVKKDIELAMKDIHRYMGYIRTGMDCWNLDVVSTAHRRMSEANGTQPVPNRMDLRQVHSHDIRPLDRSMSNADTLYGHEASPPMRRASVATTHTTLSRPSVSSASSRALHAQSDDNESISSSQGPASPKPNCDWVDFHFQITKCGSPEIKTLLQQHMEPSSLAKSTDGLQRTPLHWAAQRGDIQLASTLLDFGADINAKDSEPSTILDFAVAFNNSDFVAFLLERGVDETAVLERNRTKFQEMKRIIEFKKQIAAKPSKTSKKAERKISLSRSKACATGG